jgi:DNA-binding MarR family transcriptional regulator
MSKSDRAEDRDQQILNRLANIQHKVDSIDETNAFALRAEESKHMETVEKIFKRGIRRAQIYLAADGTRGVIEIAEHLGMKQPNVSPDVKILKEEGLLELVGTSGKRDILAKKRIDHTLRISKYLCSKYNLKPDGHSNKPIKKKAKSKKAR